MALWKDFTGVVKNVLGIKAGSNRFFGIANSNIAALKDTAYTTLEDGTITTLDNAKYSIFESQQISSVDAAAAVSMWANVTKLDAMNLIPTVEKAIGTLSGAGLTPGCVYIANAAINGLDNGNGGTVSAAIGDLILATGTGSGALLSRRLYSSMQLSSTFSGTCTAIDTITAGAIYGNEGTKDTSGYITLAWKRRLISVTTINNVGGVLKISATAAADTVTTNSIPTGCVITGISVIVGATAAGTTGWAIDLVDAVTTATVLSANLVTGSETYNLANTESQKDDFNLLVGANGAKLKVKTSGTSGNVDVYVKYQQLFT